MKKLLLLALPLAVAGVIAWGIVRKNAPPEVKFTRVARITLVSTLPTNGKVEPVEWQAVRAETKGTVSRVSMQEGQPVAKGAVLVEMVDPSLEADISAGVARVAEARANLAALEAGGRPAELTEIENSLARTRLEIQQLKNELATLQRLVEKQAATPSEARVAKEKLDQSELAVAGLEKRRTALVGKPEIAVANARLEDAQAALKLARQRAALSVVRAPIAGVVYGLTVRPGAYLGPGDAVANIGRMDRLRVRVYVDEPELGRVSVGQPVTITWQALGGREWQGKVEQMPSSIEPLGSRQVGQVVCIIENPGRDLIPGTNVDAVIRTGVVENALVIPKEALRHDHDGDFVFLVKNGVIERRPVKTGNTSVTQVQITQGLSDAENVVLPGEVPLQPGQKVATPAG